MWPVCLSVHHQPLFYPIPSFIRLFECAWSNTETFYSNSKSQFGVEIASNSLNVFLGFCELLDGTERPFDVMIGISRVSVCY